MSVWLWRARAAEDRIPARRQLTFDMKTIKGETRVLNQILISDVSENVGTLTINRPDKRNSLSPELLVKIYQTLTQWSANEAVRAVVLTGAGELMFSAGFDIGEIPTQPSKDVEALLKGHNPMDLALKAVKEFPYPTIAMLNGHCIGLALNLAMCCDYRIAADDIKVSMPPAKLGAVYPAEGIRQFVEVLGFPRAKEMFFTGATYDANVLIEMGVVNRLVNRAGLSNAAYALAAEMAANAPLSVKGIKAIFGMLSKKGGLDVEQAETAESLVNQAYRSKDLAEAKLAFAQKRKPVFVGA